MGDYRDRHPSGRKEPLPWERRLTTAFTVVVSFCQLAQWVAVEELSRAEILRKVGAAASNETAQDAATLAIVEMAQFLAHRCGYIQIAPQSKGPRNIPEP